MARDERYRRRQERKEREERECMGDRTAADMWEYVRGILGITSPSQADSAVCRLRDLNKRVRDACDEYVE